MYPCFRICAGLFCLFSVLAVYGQSSYHTTPLPTDKAGVIKVEKKPGEIRMDPFFDKEMFWRKRVFHQVLLEDPHNFRLSGAWSYQHDSIRGLVPLLIEGFASKEFTACAPDSFSRSYTFLEAITDFMTFLGPQINQNQESMGLEELPMQDLNLRFDLVADEGLDKSGIQHLRHRYLRLIWVDPLGYHGPFTFAVFYYPALEDFLEQVYVSPPGKFREPWTAKQLFELFNYQPVRVSLDYDDAPFFPERRKFPPPPPPPSRRK